MTLVKAPIEPEMSLEQLVENLQSEILTKKDMVVKSDNLSMKDGIVVIDNYKDTTNTMLDEVGIQAQTHQLKLNPNSHASIQIAEKFDIPKKYYDKLLAEVDTRLLDENVTYWMKRANKNFFIRSFINEGETQGICRALLSERFGILDNFDVLIATLEAVKSTGINIRIDTASITETNMYVRFICPDIYQESKALLENYRSPRKGNKGSGDDGDFKIYSGFILSNSEVGMGQFKISARAIVSKCNNGMIFHNENFRKTHLGARMDEGFIDWSKNTQQKNYELIMSQVKDAVNKYCSLDFLGKKIDELENQNKQVIENPNDCIQNICQSLSLSETKIKDVLSFFIRGEDNSPFGISNALNNYAYNQSTPDLRFELEATSMSLIGNVTTFDKPYKPTRKIAIIK